MKLMPWIVFICFFLLTEAGRVPDNSEISNSDVVLDDIKSNTEQSVRRRKRHFYNSHSRDFWERGMDRSYYDSYQDDRITELEIRLQIQQEQINALLSRRYEPRVIVVPTCFPSSGNKSSTNPLGNRYGGEDDIEIERVWGSADDYTGTRPISLEPVRPSRPMSNQPPVEHGTIQTEVR